MRNVKKMILLAISAAMVMAMTLPAAASAQIGEYLYQEEPFEGEANVPYEATIRNADGAVCGLKGTATFYGGTEEGHINTISSESECYATHTSVPTIRGCAEAVPTSKTLPWDLKVANKGTVVELEEFEVNANFDYIGSCYTNDYIITAGSGEPQEAHVKTQYSECAAWYHCGSFNPSTDTSQYWYIEDTVNPIYNNPRAYSMAGFLQLEISDIEFQYWG